MPVPLSPGETVLQTCLSVVWNQKKRARGSLTLTTQKLYFEPEGPRQGLAKRTELGELLAEGAFSSGYAVDLTAKRLGVCQVVKVQGTKTHRYFWQTEDETECRALSARVKQRLAELKSGATAEQMASASIHQQRREKNAKLHAQGESMALARAGGASNTASLEERERAAKVGKKHARHATASAEAGDASASGAKRGGRRGPERALGGGGRSAAPARPKSPRKMFIEHSQAADVSTEQGRELHSLSTLHALTVKDKGLSEEDFWCDPRIRMIAEVSVAEAEPEIDNGLAPLEMRAQKRATRDRQPDSSCKTQLCLSEGRIQQILASEPRARAAYKEIVEDANGTQDDMDFFWGGYLREKFFHAAPEGATSDGLDEAARIADAARIRAAARWQALESVQGSKVDLLCSLPARSVDKQRLSTMGSQHTRGDEAMDCLPGGYGATFAGRPELADQALLQRYLDQSEIFFSLDSQGQSEHVGGKLLPMIKRQYEHKKEEKVKSRIGGWLNMHCGAMVGDTVAADALNSLCCGNVVAELDDAQPPAVQLRSLPQRDGAAPSSAPGADAGNWRQSVATWNPQLAAADFVAPPIGALRPGTTRASAASSRRALPGAPETLFCEAQEYLRRFWAARQAGDVERQQRVSKAIEDLDTRVTARCTAPGNDGNVYRAVSRMLHEALRLEDSDNE